MRHFATRLAGAALLATAGAATAADTIHVCVDADGTATYTNMPCRTGRKAPVPTPHPILAPAAEPDPEEARAPLEDAPQAVVIHPTPATAAAVNAVRPTDSPDCMAARAAYRAAPRNTFSDGFEVKRRLDQVHTACAGTSPAAGAFDANTGEFYMLQGDDLVNPAQGRHLSR